MGWRDCDLGERVCDLGKCGEREEERGRTVRRPRDERPRNLERVDVGLDIAIAFWSREGVLVADGFLED